MALVMTYLGVRYLAPVDREEWLQEFAALRRHMARHYANLDWMVSHRKLDLEALTRTTEARLQGAVVRFQAEGALADFLAAFSDPHLQLDELPAGRESSGDRTSQAISNCTDLGYRNRRYDFEFPFSQAEGWRPFSDAPFPAGVIESVGVLRIAHFGEDGYRRVCEQVGVAADARATQLRVRAALQSELTQVLESFVSRGVGTVLVDLTGNGGGTEWVVDAASLFTDGTLVRAVVSMREPPCDREPIWLGQTVCGSFHPPDTESVQGQGAWTGPVLLLVDGRTASASEDFLVRLRESGVARVLGERTLGAGCGYVDSGAPARLVRIGLLVRMPNCARFTREGQNEIEGLDPDVIVPVSSGSSAEKLAALRRAAGL